MKRSRFVILRHITEPLHYDLMLEEEEGLATWSFPRKPWLNESVPQVGRRIPDHRKIYLDFEGEICGGRGRVEREDQGTFLITERTRGGWSVHFLGKRLRGTYRLERTGEPDTWHLERLTPG